MKIAMKSTLSDAHEAASQAFESARQSSFQITNFGFAIKRGVYLEEKYAVLQEGKLRVANIDEIVELKDGTRYVSGTIGDDVMGVAECLCRAPFLEVPQG